MNKPANLQERLEALRLYGVYSDLFENWNGGAEGREIMDTMNEAHDAYLEYADANGVMLLTDDNGDPIKCAVSEVPLIDGDDTDIVLRSALGLPARPKEEEGQLLPDMAEAV